MRKRHIKIAVILIITILFSNTSLVYAERVGIENQVKAYLLGDFKTGEILEGYNIDKAIEVASITKLMTYLVVMDEIKKGTTSMDSIVYIDEEVEDVKGSSLDLKEGEIFTVKELLEGLMVVSANDGGVALAKHIAASEIQFVGKMNDMAKKLKLKDTLFFNSTGLPKGNKQNLMSPRDIFTLSRHIIKEYPEVLRLSSIPYIKDEKRSFNKENTNGLLNILEGVDGLKTGYTEKAGYCLVSTIKDKENRFIGIVMGTEDEDERDEMSRILLEYGLNNYFMEDIISRDEIVMKKQVLNSKDKEVEIYPARDVNILRKRDDNIETRIVIKNQLNPPLKKEEIVGRLEVFKNGQIVDEINLIVRRHYEKVFFLITIFRYMGKIFTNLF